MEFRRLGATGLHISEISYGNWLTHGEQVAENVGAAGARLAPELLDRIDDVLGDLVERDPAKTADPMNVKPSWRRVDG